MKLKSAGNDKYLRKLLTESIYRKGSSEGTRPEDEEEYRFEEENAIDSSVDYASWLLSIHHQSNHSLQGVMLL